jgi:aryl-phospho-beta-D-glucosidase BglC (GH1 family)
VGEWSAAETDCAPALNGYNKGARYDGTYPNSNFVGSCDGINDITYWDAGMKEVYGDTLKHNLRHLKARLKDGFSGISRQSQLMSGTHSCF